MEEVIVKKRDTYEPDYSMLYPGVEITPEVMQVLRQSDRKMRYMEFELKHGSFVQNLQTQTVSFTPSREDSLERICEDEVTDFMSSVVTPEEAAIHNDEIDRLCIALKMLKPVEYELIHQIFFEDKTEESLAKKAGITQQAVSKQLKKIYRKIKNFMNL